MLLTPGARPAAAIVLLAVVVRLVAAIVVGGSLHFVDEAIYLDAARSLLQGNGFGAGYNNVPAYPVILALLASPWPESVTLVRCAQAVVAGASCALVLALGRRTFGAPAALAAGLLYALDPLLGVTAGLLYPESVAAALLLVVVLASWQAVHDDRPALTALAGLVLGVLIQMRPVALVLLPVIAAWLLWAAPGPGWRRLGHVAALALCCLIAITPWALRNQRLHGQVVPANTRGVADGIVGKRTIKDQGLVTAMADRAWRDPGDLARHVASEFLSFWELYPTRLATDEPRQLEKMHRSDPRLPTTQTFGSTLRNLVSTISFGTELALALVGVVLAWRRARPATILYLGVILAYALGFALFVAKLRYRITITPYVFLFAGLGAAVLLRAVLAAWQGARGGVPPESSDMVAS